MQSMRTVVSVGILMLVMTACAHEGATSAKKSQGDRPASVPVHDLSRLQDVLQGLTGFRERASKFHSWEWHFVLGYAHMHHGRYREAQEEFQKIPEGKLPLLQDYLLSYDATIANQVGDAARALRSAEKLLADHPESVWRMAARVEQGRALLGLRRFSEALRAFRAVLGDADDEMMSQVEQLIVQMHLAAGERDAAVNALKAMLLSCGGERELAALADLTDAVDRACGTHLRTWLEKPFQQIRLLESFVAESQWADARERLERLLARRDLDADLRTRAQWMLARSYRWTHRYDDSIALMEELRRSPLGRHISGLLPALATTYAKKNDYAKAIAIRRAMLDRVPTGSRAAANLSFKIAFLLMDEGSYADAISSFEQVAALRAAGRNRVYAKWYVGWCALMQKDAARAVKVFDELLKSGAKGARIADRVTYWKGRALALLGEEAKAREQYREVIRKYPRGYYAELAQRRLKGDPRALEALDQTLGAWPKAKRWEPGRPLDAAGSRHLERALLLDRLGLHEEVGRELAAVDLQAYSDAIPSSLFLAWTNFVHDEAYRLAYRHYRSLLKDEPGKDPFARFIWEQAYPEAYAPVVERVARDEKISPMLIWSIMRNESTFRPRVISPAGAVGLMQLMPATAGRMAKENGGEHVSRWDLFRPATNIAYGGRYLGTLSRMFPDKLPAVIASYNAGEEAVGRWLQNGRFHGMEEWIEEIPYAETNLYVKKVLTSLWTYQRLYR